MTKANGRARRDALGLLLADYTPEQVEAILAGTLPHPDAPSALSDPNNVLLEVVSDGTPDDARPR